MHLKRTPRFTRFTTVITPLPLHLRPIPRQLRRLGRAPIAAPWRRLPGRWGRPRRRPRRRPRWRDPPLWRRDPPGRLRRPQRRRGAVLPAEAVGTVGTIAGRCGWGGEEMSWWNGNYMFKTLRGGFKWVSMLKNRKNGGSMSKIEQ